MLKTDICQTRIFMSALFGWVAASCWWDVQAAMFGCNQLADNPISATHRSLEFSTASGPSTFPSPAHRNRNGRRLHRGLQASQDCCCPSTGCALERRPWHPWQSLELRRTEAWSFAPLRCASQLKSKAKQRRSASFHS